jgi:hypothetical protein
MVQSIQEVDGWGVLVVPFGVVVDRSASCSARDFLTIV